MILENKRAVSLILVGSLMILSNLGNYVWNDYNGYTLNLYYYVPMLLGVICIAIGMVLGYNHSDVYRARQGLLIGFIVFYLGARELSVLRVKFFGSTVWGYSMRTGPLHSFGIEMAGIGILSLSLYTIIRNVSSQ